jgi:ABC-2 type transport system permease protein
MVPRWASCAVLVSIALVFYRDDVRLSSEWWIYPAGLLAVLITFLLKFLYSFCISLMAFWETGIPLIGHVQRLLSGGLVPLTFLPGFLENTSERLPFAYMLYFPTTVLIGRVDPTAYLEGLTIQLLWIAVFAGLAQVIWRRGLRRYVAFGG